MAAISSPVTPGISLKEMFSIDRPELAEVPSQAETSNKTSTASRIALIVPLIFFMLYLS
jgi:hypothetical protein